MKIKVCNKKMKLMFPEFRELIPQLRAQNPYFSKIFEEHEQLDQKVSILERNPIHHFYDEIECLKRKKLQLKDQLYAMLRHTDHP